MQWNRWLAALLVVALAPVTKTDEAARGPEPAPQKLVVEVRLAWLSAESALDRLHERFAPRFPGFSHDEQGGRRPAWMDAALDARQLGELNDVMYESTKSTLTPTPALTLEAGQHGRTVMDGVWIFAAEVRDLRRACHTTSLHAKLSFLTD